MTRAITYPLLVLLVVSFACTDPRRRDADEEDDDDVADDDDATVDDDDATVDDDDDTAPDDDDTSGDDDDVSGDDDDVTPDPTPLCMTEALDSIEASGILPPEVVWGDLPPQTLYSCETYQLTGVTLLSTETPITSEGTLGSWTLEATPSVAVNDAATPATLNLTGCDPYTCSIYTNQFPIVATLPLTMSVAIGDGGASFIDVIFGTLSHDIQSQLLGNFILAGCSLGNLNEDLQAQGVDIFTVLVNDVNPQFGLAMQQHLAVVEAAAEVASYACMAP